MALLINLGTRCLLITAQHLDNGAGYRLLPFDATGADYLLVSRKGEGGYDHNTAKAFVFPVDSVEVNWFEKAARAYIYKEGAYDVVQTSD